MMSTLSYYILFLCLTMLDAKRMVNEKDTGNHSPIRKQVSQLKTALCKVNSKLMQTVNELNQTKTELNATRLSLNATRLSLNVLKIQLEKHIAQDQQDFDAIRKVHEKLLANGNQVMQTEKGPGTPQLTTPVERKALTTTKTTTTTTTTTILGKPGTSQRPRDCSDVRALGRNVTGIYRVYPDIQEKRVEMDVYCDFSSPKDSWMVFQRRKDGRENFNRLYSEYERGFGNLTRDFWFGNEKLHLLTSSRKYKLRIELSDFQGTKMYAEYSIFSVDSAANSYKLTIGGYSGTAGDSLAYHNGMKFTAKDVDNDLLPNANCASNLRAGWWYKTCHASNLNGLYLEGRHKAYGTGIIWSTWHGFYLSLKSTEMKIAPQ